MISDRETTRIVRSWLEDGATALPDRVLDAVLEQLPVAPQRRPWRGYRLFSMHPAVAFALGSVLAVAVTLLGVTYLARPNIGAPPHAEQTPTPSPAAVLPAGKLDPGTYRLGNRLPVPVAFDVPAGLRRCDAEAICGQSIWGLSFITVSNVVVDPCDSDRQLRDPPVGPTVDDLVTALRGLPGFRVDSLRPVVVDGYRGIELEITAPSTARCQLLTWTTPDRINGVAQMESNRMRIIDVDGTRVVLALAHGPTTPPSDLAALQQVMDSVRFDDH